VLSTLHTNDAPGAIARLIEMGVEPFLVLSAVELRASPSASRGGCATASSEVVLAATSCARTAYDVDGDDHGLRAGGCARCGGTGYKGRIGLYEVMPVTDEIRSSPSPRVGRRDRRGGGARRHAPLRDEGLEKVLAGLTSFAELARVTV
jgi:type IV pilus assembly protein PilB